MYDGVLEDLSEQAILQCNTNITWGCNGGWPYGALDYLVKNGAPLSSDFPYMGYNFYSNICQAGNFKKLSYNATVIDYYDKYLTDDQIE